MIRGEDHVSNTPKQIRILEALGRELPVYAHVPNVFGTDGKKLSKRHGAVSVEEFREKGYLAPALMNYLALLGWSYDDRTTEMSRDELVERFTLDRVGSSPATFDYAKLDWLNGVYLRELPPAEFADTLVAYLREQGFEGDEETIRASAPLVQEKISRLEEYPGFAGFFFERVEPPAELLEGSEPVLAEARETLAGVEPFTAEPIEGALRGTRRAPRAQAARRVRPDPRGGHRLEGLARALREPGAPRPRGVPGPPQPLAIEDEAAREEGEAGRPDRPGGEHGAGGEEERAADDEDGGDDRRERGALAGLPARLGLGRSVGAERPHRPLQRAEAREADAEERAPPLRQERLNQLGVAGLEDEPDLGGDVPRLAERGDQLGVERLAAAGRVDPDRELGAGVKGVLELRELVEEAVRDPLGRVLGDALEPNQRRPYALPNVLDGRRVAPRLIPSNRPLHASAIICARDRRRPGWAPAERRPAPRLRASGP